MKMCEIMRGEKYGKALKTVMHTKSMSEDISEQLQIRTKFS